MTHTPGPWIVSDETNPLIFGGGTYVAQVLMYSDGTTGNLRDTAHADAALISAAPDMLAALEQALAHAQALPFTLGPSMTEPAIVFPAWVDAARAAIARAKGQA